jgi:hypothetical protein
MGAFFSKKPKKDTKKRINKADGITDKVSYFMHLILLY